jgi:hypothetical protein
MAATALALGNLVRDSRCAYRPLVVFVTTERDNSPASTTLQLTPSGDAASVLDGMDAPERRKAADVPDDFEVVAQRVAVLECGP